MMAVAPKKDPRSALYPLHLREFADRSTPGYLLGAFGPSPMPPQGAHTSASARLVEVHQWVTDGWSQSWKYHTRVMADQTRPEQQRQVMSAHYVRQRRKVVEEKYRKALEAVAEDTERLTRVLHERLRPGRYDREVREHFAKLDGNYRMQFLERAHREQDVATLSALLAAPPYLTGMPEGSWEEHRERFFAAQAPTEAAQLKALTAAVG